MSTCAEQATTLIFEAVDTWMFRDGRPFGQADIGASEASSVFPPFPPTLVGAVRAALWREALGGKWNEKKLGDGTDWQSRHTHLGPLRFGPPLVLHDGKPVFPAPLHLVEGKNKDGARVLTFLEPVEAPFDSDWGERAFPAPQDASLEGIKTINDRWLTLAGMEAILCGELPDEEHWIESDRLWRHESRVGIAIDSGARTVRQGLLYMASHARPAADVSLAVTVAGWADDVPQALVPMAGEHRMAAMRVGRKITLPRPAANLRGEYLLIAISPVAPDKHGNISGLPEDKVISACIGKPVPIGGWDSQNRQAINLRRCWPAGSVWFIRDGGTPPESIGLATEWGFGRVLAAAWPSKGAAQS